MQKISISPDLWARTRRTAFDRGITASRLVEQAIEAFLEIPVEGDEHRPGVAIVPNDRPAERDPRMTLRNGGWVPETEVGKELRRIGTQIGIDPAVPGGDQTAEVVLDGGTGRVLRPGPMPWDKPDTTLQPPADGSSTTVAAGPIVDHEKIWTVAEARLAEGVVVNDPVEAAKVAADLASKNGRTITPVTKESQTGRTRKPRR